MSALPAPGRRAAASVPLTRRARDPQWYKDAIIYELRVRSFYDANGDGIGDFQGLAEKLDYLHDLGVTTLWLLPFYPSPLRDDGYDISDYTDIHPDLGTLTDFKRFLDEAHRRGLRVITELVLNHTSDQHRWFRRARCAPRGSDERAYYVWSDTAEEYKDARIIFKDFEASNWSWDPVAKAYFWHRFYAHQPDLNFEHPGVQRALLDAVDFWLGLGVDGLRLDAVPYLYEREGTSSENLPETHDFLKRLRAHVDERWEDRMLLAEANQWPEDAAAYFGTGDECHMAFHFPIMPRLFMAIHVEDRFPIIDILEQTPALPPQCQWALFLRNHDELTLEMVTDEERDYMVRAYAHEPTMRINLGIRRRLAPLLGNDRRNVELLNALLFSLPGTPILYYGDEIGMGDNVYLGDRDGVRTPMQWSADRNAGFSRANPQRLVLPIIIDPEYHFESLNVEAQQNNTSSLLWWTKRLVALRKRFAAFGRGSIEFLRPDNPRVLAFVRQYEGETILVVANLSRLVQYVELDLSALKGRVPVELFGHTEFPPIGELPYLLTLGGHAFYWFSLEPQRTAATDVREAGYQPPSIEVTGGFESALVGEERAALGDAMARYLSSRSWFAGRGRRIHGVHVASVIPTGDVTTWLSETASEEARNGPSLVVIAVDHGDADPSLYLLASSFEREPRAAELRARSPLAVIANLRLHRDGAVEAGVVLDALADPALCRTLIEALLARGRVECSAGTLAAKAGMRAFAPESSAGEQRTVHAPPTHGRLGGDRESTRPACTSVTSILGNTVFVRLHRRLDAGTSPDLEVGQFLAHKAPGPTLPPVVGSVELLPTRGEPLTIAVLREFVDNQGDALTFTLEELRRYFERVLTRGRDEPPALLPRGRLVESANELPPPAVSAMIGTYLDTAELLGRRTAELHHALASDPEAPAFAPEAISASDQRSTYQTMRSSAGRVLRALRATIRYLPAPAVDDARSIVARDTQAMKRFSALLGGRLTGLRMRCHGDYDLCKVLYTGRDFAVADFEGDPARSVAERRRKASPLRDVASMLRSLHDAAFSVLYDAAVVRPEDREAAELWALAWQRWVSAAFLRGYLRTAGNALFLPRDRAEIEVLLDAFQLERAFAALGRALTPPQEGVFVRLRSLSSLLAADT